VKLTRSLAFAVLAAACALVVTVARAGSGCPDDPERCIERGASSPRTANVATSAARTVAPAPATAVVASARKPAAAPARKSPSRPAHATPLPSTATPATPGMGMLLKLSGGTGGDVSWYPSRPADNNGASWVL